MGWRRITEHDFLVQQVKKSESTFRVYLLGKRVPLSCVYGQRDDTADAMASSGSDVIHSQNARFPRMVVSRKRYTPAKAAAVADQIRESGLDDGSTRLSSVLHEQTDPFAPYADIPAGDVSQVTLWIVIDHGVADGPTGNVGRLSRGESIPELADDVFGVEAVAQEPSSAVGATSAVDPQVGLAADDTDAGEEDGKHDGTHTEASEASYG